MELLEVIKVRRSIRNYSSKPISEDVLKKILGAARLAPSALNAQPWKFIVVRDEDRKLKIACACNNNKWMAQAPIIIVACGYPDEADAFMGGYMNSFPVDVALAMDHLVLAATNENVGTCIKGRFKEEKIRDILEIPNDVRVVALITLGYAKETPDSSGRKNLSEIICYDKFS